jgi:hypothetical protein
MSEKRIKMEPVRVHGFTDNQIKHADCLWQLQSQEEVKYYMAPLKGQDWTDAQVALSMLSAEVMDQIDNFPQEVQEIFKSIK